jgi:predicted HNH restriction endonuclease
MKEIPQELLDAFYQWLKSDPIQQNETKFQNEVRFDHLNSRNDKELIELFVDFKSKGGGIQRPDNRLIEQFETSISIDIALFREYILRPFEPGFNIQQWISELVNYSYFGIGAATIYLHRVDSRTYPILNDKVRKAVKLLGGILASNANNADAYRQLMDFQRAMINRYDFKSLFEVDAFYHFIIGDKEGRKLAKKYLKSSLFLNGVYETVIKEIIESQKKGQKKNFLQPYSQNAIEMLRSNPPTANSPVTTYISTTDNLNEVTYQAEIIQWYDKQKLTPEKLKEFNDHISNNQPNEKSIYISKDGNGEKILHKNLLHIIGLKKITPFHVSELIKLSDGKPCQNRTMSGKWSEIYRVEPVDKEKLDKEFELELNKSQELSPKERQKNLPSPGHKPDKGTAIITVYRRNSNVVAEALYQANGICGLCKCDAPFNKHDGTPYLEVHHWTPLSEDGDDTIENAVALCPNCHKRAHLGGDKDFILKNHSLPVEICSGIPSS